LNRRRVVQRPDENSGVTAGWLTTFNDLVTLLMVFFVLLFAIGSRDKLQMKEFQSALQSGLGVLGAGSRVSIAVQQSQTPISPLGQLSQSKNETEPEDQLAEKDPIDDKFSEFAAQFGINVSYSKQGIHISFEEGFVFDFGQADINAKGFAFLDEMAVLIQQDTYAVRVEGHTDNVPIHTQRFPSNWELSIARAVSVVKYFIDAGKIDPQRLSAVGYGESRPLMANNSPGNRAKNRRVEIVLATEDEK
jgi:chemotaxis protein MotB